MAFVKNIFLKVSTPRFRKVIFFALEKIFLKVSRAKKKLSELLGPKFLENICFTKVISFANSNN